MVESRWQLFTRASVQSRAIKTGLVVGTILGVINYGDLLLAGEMSMAQWMKLLVTYLVPYSVASWSSVQALRA